MLHTIGDSAGMLEFRGHPVLRLNLWATGHQSMLITHLKQVALGRWRPPMRWIGDLVAFRRRKTLR